MKMPKSLVALIVIGCTALPVLAIIGYEAYRTRDLTADIVARAPERGNFSPSRVRVPVGEPVKLRVRNVDTVMHGFTIPELGVESHEISAGHQAVIEFTPDKVGEYEFYCTTWCSDYHLQMKGVVEVVEPASGARKL